MNFLKPFVKNTIDSYDGLIFFNWSRVLSDVITLNHYD